MGYSILKLSTDLKKRDEGIEVPLSVDAHLLIASNGSPAYALSYQKHRAKVKVKDGEHLTEQQAIDVMAEAYADAILLGWKGIDDEKGQPLKYSRKAAIKLLKNPEYAQLFEFVLKHSGEQAAYRKSEIEAEKKP